jgi:transformation/transcription domain-associated protein
MVWFRECWHEEVLRQLRQGLTKCYQVAFETRGDGKSDICDFSKITQVTIEFRAL